MDHPARGIVGAKGNFLGTPSIDRIGLDCQQPDVFQLSHIVWPFNVTIGSTIKGAVEFSRNAPSRQSFPITLSGSVISVPTMGSVSAGTKRREFDITTLATGCAVIGITYGGIFRARGVVVQPERSIAYPLYLNTPETWVLTDRTATAEFASSAAPGTIISLTSSDPEVVSVPSTLVVSSADKRQFTISGHRSGCAEIVASMGSYKVRRFVRVMTFAQANGREM
jgi:hypothetical protein